MAFLEWSDAYSVGVERYDHQHQQLARMLNELHDAMLAGKGSEKLGPILDGLIQYTKTHFHDEENEMARYGYASLKAHVEEHRKLTDQVIDFQTKLKNGQVVLSVPVMQFLKEWLTHHIMETDKQYGPLLSQHL